MTTASSFFQFGADNETIRNCLRLMERALNGETRAQRISRCTVKFKGHTTYKHGAKKPKP